MSLVVSVSDKCPKCFKPIRQAEIQPHPTRSDYALQNFECEDCGVVKTKVYSLKPSTQSEAAA
jgi:hypothetical protein